MPRDVIENVIRAAAGRLGWIVYEPRIRQEPTYDEELLDLLAAYRAGGVDRAINTGHTVGECVECDAARALDLDLEVGGHALVAEDEVRLESGGTLERGQRVLVCGLSYEISAATAGERAAGARIQWHDTDGTHTMAIAAHKLVPVPRP